MIHGEIKKDISGSQSLLSGKVPDVNPGFFESLWIGASWVSTTVHFVHGPENHFQIICFDEIEEGFVLFIEYTISYLLG